MDLLWFKIAVGTVWHRFLCNFARPLMVRKISQRIVQRFTKTHAKPGCLDITQQPKGVVFSYRKRWLVSTGLKHHTLMKEQRFQHLKAIIDSFHAILWYIDPTKNDIQIQLGQVLNDTKFMLVTFSTIFLYM